VIAIIAILASLLMPALEQARSAARRSVCTARLRQQGIAQQMYVNEFGTFMPHRGSEPHRVWVDAWGGWIGQFYETFDDLLVEYGQTSEIYYCPTGSWGPPPTSKSFSLHPNGVRAYCDYALVFGLSSQGLWIDLYNSPASGGVFFEGPPAPGKASGSSLNVESSSDCPLSADVSWSIPNKGYGTVNEPHWSNHGHNTPQGGNVLYLDHHSAWVGVDDLEARCERNASWNNTFFW
jgi:type II secretory pathway pseudopilin PulG